MTRYVHSMCSYWFNLLSRNLDLIYLLSEQQVLYKKTIGKIGWQQILFIVKDLYFLNHILLTDFFYSDYVLIKLDNFDLFEVLNFV